jgi:hypothetical protein
VVHPSASWFSGGLVSRRHQCRIGWRTIAHRAPEQSATLLGVAALNPFAACHPPEHHDTISEKGLVAIA